MNNMVLLVVCEEHYMVFHKNQFSGLGQVKRYKVCLVIPRVITKCVFSYCEQHTHIEVLHACSTP